VPRPDNYATLALWLLLCSLPGAAEAANAPFRARPADGGFPGEWLTAFSAGARNAGLANAATALTGAAAAYANPAGITANPTGEVVLMVAPLIASGQYQAVSVSYPLSVYDSMSFSFLHLGSGAAEKTDALGQSVGSFDEQDYAFLLSYAQRSSKDLAAGITLKAVNQSVAELSGTGFGVDLGLQAKPVQDLTLGLSVLNVLPPAIKLYDKEDVFPVSYRAGAVYSFSNHRTFLLCSDVVLSVPAGGRRVARPGLGLEIQPLSDEAPFLVRLGINQREYTLGFSVKAGPVSFDYAAAFHELETLHRFGLTMRYDVLPFFAEKKKKAELLKNLKQEAGEWLKTGNYAKCEETVRRILEIDKSDSDAPIIAVEIQKRRDAAQISQRLAQAKEAALAKQAEAKTLALARLNEAKGLYLAKQYRKALETLKDSLPLLPDNLLAQGIVTMSLAHIFMEEGKYPEAMKQLRKAVETDPDNREALFLYKRIQDITGSN
jgi:Tfp pilus assembly protein PilF